MFAKPFTIAIAATALASGLLLTAPLALAVDCQGLQETACAAKPGCQWVDPYERKDGVKVTGYCRANTPIPNPAGDRSGASQAPAGAYR